MHLLEPKIKLQILHIMLQCKGIAAFQKTFLTFLLFTVGLQISILENEGMCWDLALYASFETNLFPYQMQKIDVKYCFSLAERPAANRPSILIRGMQKFALRSYYIYTRKIAVQILFFSYSYVLWKLDE